MKPKAMEPMRPDPIAFANKWAALRERYPETLTLIERLVDQRFAHPELIEASDVPADEYRAKLQLLEMIGRASKKPAAVRELIRTALRLEWAQ